MNYFISDLHFGHEKVIEHAGRPFANVVEMDETLIRNWNDRVKGNDTVYIIGDLGFDKFDAPKVLHKLKGRKVLIAGNHDAPWLKKCGFAKTDRAGNVEFCDYSEYFKKIARYEETHIDGMNLTLCHYPMVEWKNSRIKFGTKIGYLIHGHTHCRVDDMYRGLYMTPNALNAGVDINGFMPVTFSELVRNNEKFKLDALSDELDRAVFLARKYHLYQFDKSGRPYILHPTTVASMLTDKADKCVAYLHDILEDTDIDVKILEKYFSKEITDAVKTMTHAPGVDYFDYIEIISHNERATRVKLADLTHNMDLSRLPTVTDRDLARREKYKKAYAILSSKLGNN